MKWLLIPTVVVLAALYEVLIGAAGDWWKARAEAWDRRWHERQREQEHGAGGAP